MRKIRGFTLIELLVVLAIAAVLVMLAAPSFKRTIQSNSISSGANTFMSDLRFARSEAIRLGGAVVVCRSDEPEAPSPACGPNPSSTFNRNWVSGWIVFQDQDNDGTKDAAEPVLRVQEPIKSIDSILEAGTTSTSHVRFTATGRLLNSTSATQLTFGGGDFATEVQRVLCVSFGGRARIAGDGSTACGSDNE